VNDATVPSTQVLAHSQSHSGHALMRQAPLIRLVRSRTTCQIGCSWGVHVQEPRSLVETAERFVRPSLQDKFINLCTQPISHYLERFPFQSDLVKAMYATTDGFSGLSGSWDTPGTGMNFLAHNMCRLGGSGGTWMVVEGGMGSVTQQLALRAAEAGAAVETGAHVEAVLVGEGGVATGVRVATVAGVHEVRARVVLVNGDPFRLRALLSDAAAPPALDALLSHLHRDGMTMKV
jgi:phytoene dehydrogenase-like protein